MSAPVRDTQLSLVEGMERPVGPLPLSVQTGNNADLIARVAPMYLSGSVLDVTYGRGKWWDRFTPEPFTFHDLHTVDGVDFRQLPHDDNSFDTVCFDPPYVYSGPPKGQSGADLQDRFGLRGQSVSSVYGLMLDGLTECCRVSRQLVLVKCMEFAQGEGMHRTGFHDVPTLVATGALDLGWAVHDRIVHHSGTGVGGHNITTIKRARRAHSYLLVFVPISDSPRDSGRSDAGAETLSASVFSDGGSSCLRPPTGPAVSHSTNEETPALTDISRGS